MACLVWYEVDHWVLAWLFPSKRREALSSGAWKAPSPQGTPADNEHRH